MLEKRKVVIIGAGHVGSHCAWALAVQGTADEVVLLDIDKDKVRSNALDVADGVGFMGSRTVVRVGGYEDVKDADLVVISIGMPRKPGQTRLEMLDDSIAMLQDVIRNMKPLNYQGIIITITNPADIIADYVRRHLELPRERCFSTGTSLDSTRLRRTIGELCGVDPRSVSAFSLGEHGNSSMIPFSTVTIGGKKYTELRAEKPERYGKLSEEYILDQTREIGITIIEGKGSTEFGIGITLADMAKAVLHDEHRVLPASVLLEGEYGQRDVHAGVPCIIGRNGIEEIIELPLTEKEQEQFNQSCDIIRQHIARAETIQFN